MNSVGEYLQAADPAREEGGLRSGDVARMRATILAATLEPRVAVSPVAAMLVAALAVVVGAGAWVVNSAAFRTSGSVTRLQPTTAAPERPLRRQLQFATPGGTRVIWTFDPAFELR